jgi:hypothetical protein
VIEALRKSKPNSLNVDESILKKTTDKGTSDTHNGMPHLAAKKIAIILTFAAPSVAEKHDAEALQFINSIKKTD